MPGASPIPLTAILIIFLGAALLMKSPVLSVIMLAFGMVCWITYFIGVHIGWTAGFKEGTDIDDLRRR